MIVNDSNWIASIFGMLMAACIIIGVPTCAYQVDQADIRARTTHNLTPGFCVKHKDGESWDQVWKIEVVGNRNYLLRRIPENVNKTSEGFSLSFPYVERVMDVVPCPKG